MPVPVYGGPCMCQQTTLRPWPSFDPLLFGSDKNSCRPCDHRPCYICTPCGWDGHVMSSDWPSATQPLLPPGLLKDCKYYALFTFRCHSARSRPLSLYYYYVCTWPHFLGVVYRNKRLACLPPCKLRLVKYGPCHGPSSRQHSRARARMQWESKVLRHRPVLSWLIQRPSTADSEHRRQNPCSERPCVKSRSNSTT